LYFSKRELKVQDYVDANFRGEVDNQRSTSYYIFNVDTITTSWMSQIQKDCFFIYCRGWVCNKNRS